MDRSAEELYLQCIRRVNSIATRGVNAFPAVYYDINSPHAFDEYVGGSHAIFRGVYFSLENERDGDEDEPVPGYFNWSKNQQIWISFEAQTDGTYRHEIGLDLSYDPYDDSGDLWESETFEITEEEVKTLLYEMYRTSGIYDAEEREIY